MHKKIRLFSWPTVPCSWWVPNGIPQEKW